jgi:N-acetylmuramoyl-L-alanine amidase
VALAAAVLLTAGAGGAAAALPLVAIDPGHGGRDPGAVGTLAAGTQTGLPPRTTRQGLPAIYEKDVNLDVARRLDGWLRARGFRTVMTRTQDLAGGDVPYTTQGADLRARTRTANLAGADVFVSIHQNALSASSRGTETYHFYYSSRAARSLAVSVHQEVVLRLGLPDRGVKTAGFYVLKNTVMPAILVEGAFLSNPSEAALLARPEARQRLAEGIGAGLVRYSQGVRVPGTGYGPSPRTAPLVIRYWVTAGVFRKRADALRQIRRLRGKRVEAVLKRRYTARARRTMFHVVTGQFIFLQNAKEQRATLRGVGLRPAINGAPGARRR